MHKTLFKILRHFSGLAQHELAEIMNLSQSTIAKYETGERAITLEAERKQKEIAFASGTTQRDINALQKLIDATNKRG